MKYANANIPMSWEYGNDVIFCDFTYSCNNAVSIAANATSYANALKTYATNTAIPYALHDDGTPIINVGLPVVRNTREDKTSVTFTLAKASTYFENGQTITATRDDFADLIDDYGIAGAYAQMFRDALDEYTEYANLKDYVVVNITINEILY